MKLSFDTNSTPELKFSSSAASQAATTPTASQTTPDFILYRERPFESECFSNRTFEILSWESTSKHNALSPLLDEFLAAQKLQPGDLLYLRLAADDIAALKDASAAGFYFIESSIIPTLKLRRWNKEQFSKMILPTSAASVEDMEEVERIAASTFRGLRFNLDPHIGNEKADRRYLTWLRNAYANGEDIRVLRHKGEIVGFSLLRHEDSGVTVFRLAGVRPDLKSSGLGTILYASTVAHCHDRGVAQVDGGISMANCPVLNVMSSLGFTFRDPSIVMHYYVRAGE